VTGENIFFDDIIHSKVLDHDHVPVEIDLVNRDGDQVVTSIGDVEKSSLGEKLQYLSQKNKGDQEFLDQISYLNGFKNIVSEFRNLLKFE
jgi:hypothetical protein